MSNAADIQTKFAGSVALDEGGESAVFELFAVASQYSHGSAENASTNVANTRIWSNPYSFSVRVGRACYAPDGTLTADNTNYAQIQLLTDDGNAGTKTVSHIIQTTLNSATGASGNFAANIVENFALSNATANVIPAGGGLYFNIVKQGSGGDVPAGTIIFTVEKL